MIITLASGKGGTGKTTVAVNLAAIAAGQGIPTHLLDCDVEEPNAHLYLGLELGTEDICEMPLPLVDQARCRHCGRCAEICEFNAIACLPEQTVVFPELCHSCSGCWLVCPEQAIGQGSRAIGKVLAGSGHGLDFTGGLLNVGETQVPPLIEAVCARQKFPSRKGGALVIRDAPPGAACPAVAALKGSDFAVLVTEPTAFGLNDLEIAVELARGMGLPFAVLINRDGMGDSRIQDYCRREGICLLPSLPFSLEAARAVSRGDLLVREVPPFRGAFSRLLEALLREVQEVCP
jgi:MinD superfamily P-loop ATPase